MSIRWSGPVGERQTPKKRSTTLIDRIMRSAAPSAGVKCPVHRTYISQAGDRRHPLRWISQTEVWSAAVRPRVIQSRMEGPPAVGGWEAREEVAPACGRCLPPERHRRGRLGQGGGRRALGRCDTGLLLLLGTRPPPPGANHAHCQPRLASSAERPARPRRRDRPGHSGVAGDQPLAPTGRGCLLNRRRCLVRSWSGAARAPRFPRDRSCGWIRLVNLALPMSFSASRATAFVPVGGGGATLWGKSRGSTTRIRWKWGAPQ